MWTVRLQYKEHKEGMRSKEGRFRGVMAVSMYELRKEHPVQVPWFFKRNATANCATVSFSCFVFGLRRRITTGCWSENLMGPRFE